MWHSCVRVPLAAHFEGKDPVVRRLYRHYVRAVRAFGPITVYAQKTRIIFMVRVRFAGCEVRKSWLDCAFWLTRRTEHPRLYKYEFIPPRYHLYRFRMTVPEDLDEEMLALLRESYRLGRQEAS